MALNYCHGALQVSGSGAAADVGLSVRMDNHGQESFVSPVRIYMYRQTRYNKMNTNVVTELVGMQADTVKVKGQYSIDVRD